MHEPPLPDTVVVEDSTETLQTWMSREYLTPETRDQLQQANVLIVPIERFRESAPPCFPVGTESLLQFFRENAPSGVVVDICIEDEKYVELSLHSDWVRLGHLVLSYGVTPLVIGLLANYIYDKLRRRVHSATVRCDITIDDRGKTIRYEGPAETFEKSMSKALQELDLHQTRHPKRKRKRT